jgi:spore germination cell wall hydrolase CwlJ-like protein
LLSFLSVSTQAKPKQDINCLAQNIYHEARSESIKTQLSVGIITINRAKTRFHNKKNPICSAVMEKNQFSWTRNKRNNIKEQKIYFSIKELSTRLYKNYFLNNTIPRNLAILKNIYYFAEKGYRPIKNGIRVAKFDSFIFWRAKA